MDPTRDFTIARQVFWLLVLALPIACVARTVVFEEIFREVRQWCTDKSKSCGRLLQRKFFYIFTCEYCFSHYVTILFLIITRFKLLIDDWRGYVIAFFALVSVANAYMNFYARLKVDITSEKKEIERKEKEIEHKESQIARGEEDAPAPAPVTVTVSAPAPGSAPRLRAS
jgi:hypothetical protein